MIISIISIITLFSIINLNYAFADNKDTQVKPGEARMKKTEILFKIITKIINVGMMQSASNQSLEQLNNQVNQCRDGANCVNESVSNIIVCEEKSLCLIQYEGPFELLNPY